jgi:hypothetical protein
MTFGFFTEEDGLVRHTSLSAVMLRKPYMHDILGLTAEFVFQASAKLVDAMVKYPESQEPNETGFNLAYGTREPLLEYFGKETKRASLFSNAMKGLVDKEGFSHEHIICGHDWSVYENATVIDVSDQELFFSLQFP